MTKQEILFFEWHDSKNKSNIRKHGIPFHEAESVFLDDRGILISDPDRSEFEDRFLLIGMSTSARLIVVSHCYRKGKIRVLSARKASITESLIYSGFRG